MSQMIEIRDLPDETYRMLETRAIAEGISLSDFIERELGVVSGLLTFELDARVRARGRSAGTTEGTVRIIRESRGEF